VYISNNWLETLGSVTGFYLPDHGSMYRIYFLVDLFCTPFLMEGSHALLEAQSAMVPVIAASVGAIPELIIDGVTGMLVRPADSDDMARNSQLPYKSGAGEGPSRKWF